MSELVNFLLHRLDEDEREFRSRAACQSGPWPRLLEDVEAKRKVVLGYDLAIVKAEERPSVARLAALDTLHTTVKILANPFHRHPDYRTDWT